MTMIKILLHLIRADLMLFLRGRLAMFWTFAFPLLLLVMLMALFGHDMKLGPVSIAIRDLDQTQTSGEYVRELKAGLHAQKNVDMEISMISPSTISAGPGADFTLTIPAGFAENVAAGRTTNLDLKTTRAEGPILDATYGMLRGYTDGYNLNGLTQAQRANLPPPKPGIDVLSYGLFLVTGLAGMVILSTALMGFSVPLVAAREGGMFRLYQLLPMPTGLVVLAWWVTRLIVTLAASVLMLLVACAIYGVQIHANASSIASAALILSLGTGAFLSIGLLIASITNSVAAANIVCNLLYFPLLFSGNLMMPVDGLPKVLRTVLDCFPLNAMVGSLRRSLTETMNWRSEAYSVTMLSVLLFVCLYIASKRFSWMPRS